MKYDWKRYTNKSDERYRKALKDGVTKRLESHNILRDGDIEIQFIFDVIRAFSGKKISKKNALDVCCGAGYMSRCLEDQGYSVVGFDLNEDAIAIAQENSDTKGIYVVNDASNPTAKEIVDKKYDLIFIREAHPFSRIEDYEFQKEVLDHYTKLLNRGGVMVIAHARQGGGMSFSSVSFPKIGDYLSGKGYLIVGPLYLFLYKHLSLKHPGRFVISLQSFLFKILSRLFWRRRWIEFFFVISR